MAYLNIEDQRAYKRKWRQRSYVKRKEQAYNRERRPHINAKRSIWRKMKWATDEEYREEHRRRERERAKTLKEKVLSLYSGKCTWCSYNDPRALQLDHINNDGYKERCGNSRMNASLRNKKILADPSYAAKFQLLCANCNQIKKVEYEATLKSKKEKTCQ